MRVVVSLLALVLLCSVVAAEFTLVAELHGTTYAERLGSNIDIDGDYAVLGAEGGINVTASRFARFGAAYVLHRGSNGWEEVQVMYGEGDGDQFGIAVAISGDWIAVGAPWTDPGSEPRNSGSVYLYKKNGSGLFELKQRLVNRDQDAFDHFGFCVSMDGTRLIVGVPYAENETSTAAGDTSSDQGSVFIFERTGDTWSLVFNDHGSDQGGGLGYTVAISGDYAFGGAFQGDSSPSDPGNDKAGVVIVYHRSAASEWSIVQSLTAPTPGFNEQFSNGLDAAGDLLAVGARFAKPDSRSTHEGELSVFRRNSDGQYELEAVIPGPPSRRYHGLCVSIAHGVIAAGSPTGSYGSTGTATIYQHVDGTWTATHTMDGGDFGAKTASDFSCDVAVEVTSSQATLVVGARTHTEGDDPEGITYGGAVWVFENPAITIDDAPPASAVQWSAPCGCDGLGAAPIAAHAAESTSVTLSFDATLPNNAPCVAEPVQ